MGGGGTHLTHQLVPAVQVGGPENVVPLQRLQQKVVPDAGDAVRRGRGLRRAGGPEVGAEALVRLSGPQAGQLVEIVGFVSRPPIAWNIDRIWPLYVHEELRVMEPRIPGGAFPYNEEGGTEGGR